MAAAPRDKRSTSPASVAVAQAIKEHLARAEGYDTNGIVVERCTKRVGDFRLDVASLLPDGRRADRAACNEVAELLRGIGIVADAVAIPPSVYLRMTTPYLRDTVIATARTASALRPADGPTVVMSFSNPNTNKPLHLGHLRNNFVGMALSRLLEAEGCRPVRVDLLSDWGIHLCKALHAYRLWGEGATPESAGVKGDHFIGRFLVRFHQDSEAPVHEDADSGAGPSPPLEAEARELLRRVEQGDSELTAALHRMTSWVKEGFRQTYERIGTSFDLTMLESEGRDEARRIIDDAVAVGVCTQRDDGSVSIDLTDVGLWDVTLLRGDRTATVYTQQLGAKVKLAAIVDPARWIVVFGRDWEKPFAANREMYRRFGLAWGAVMEGAPHGMVSMADGRMRSRYGTAVTADALLDHIRGDLVARWPGPLQEEWFTDESVRERLALGLGKYYLLRVARTKDVMYDEVLVWDVALPRFAVVVAASRRLATARTAASADGRGESIHPLLRCMDGLSETLHVAALQLDPVFVVRFVDDLCRHLSGVPDGELDPELADAASLVLERALDILGIDVPGPAPESGRPEKSVLGRAVGREHRAGDVPEYDVVGIGAGPSNLSLAVLTEDRLRTRFFDAKPHFSWHAGLMVKDAQLQVAFLKDLVTPVDPTNRHSFLNFLATTGRLYRFIMSNRERIPRAEYAQYFGWVAERLDAVEFGRTVSDIVLTDNAIEVHVDGRPAARTRNLVLATGRRPKVPAFAESLLGPRVLHSSALLDVAPDASGRRVLVVGGGQSGAEVFRHFIGNEGGPPRSVTWLTNRVTFLPMDESPFSSEWFNPNYVAHFMSLPGERRQRLLRQQVLSSDGISGDLLESIYQRLYDLDYLEGRPFECALRPSHQLMYLEPDGAGYAAAIRSEDTGEVARVGFDLVVLCTGYEDGLPACAASLGERLLRHEDGLVVAPDYSLAWDGPAGCRVFGQNMAKHTHGIADPNLSLTAWRAAVIANAVFGEEVYPLRRDSVTTTWTTLVHEPYDAPAILASED